MNYRKYQNARDLAWRVLINEKVTALPVDVVALCHRLGIKVKYYQPEDDNDGYCTIFLGRPWIFVSQKCTTARQRFTVAHELGHFRSEERRVGKECEDLCRSRWSPYH